MMARVSCQAEGRSIQDEAAAIPRPTVTAAAPVPAPARAAITHHPLPRQHHPVALLGHPAPGGREGAAALLLTNPGVGAEAIAPAGIAMRRSGTGGGAATTDQDATKKSTAIPGSAEAAGVDPDPEGETGVEPGPEIAAAERGKRRGRGAGRAETAVAAEAINTNKRPPAKRGGGRGVTAMRKTRKRRRRKEILIKRKRR